MRPRLLSGIATIVCFFAILFPTARSFSNDLRLAPKEIDKLFARWNNMKVPGASLAIVHRGKIVYKKGYGLANLEYSIPNTPSSVFHVASVSKQFTAFAVALLADEGKLSFDDDIRKHIPELHDFGHKITLRHLVWHTSGLRDQWELLVLAGWRMDDVITHDHIMKLLIRQRELNFVPGERFLYCNSGYTLLAEIVSRVSKMPFTEFCKRRIFKPLGMKNTHFHLNHGKIVRNRAYSYFQRGLGRFEKANLNYANVGATSLFTTVEDAVLWLDNFRTAKVGGPNVQKTIRQINRFNNGGSSNYAFGILINPYRAAETISHSGGDAGYRSFVIWFPEHELGIAVFGNHSGFSPAGIAYRVADILLRNVLPVVAPRPKSRTVSKSFVVKRELLRKYPGIYTSPNRQFEILQRESALFVRVGTARTYRLVAISSSKFLFREGNATIDFGNEEKSSSITKSVEIRVGGQTIVAKRSEKLDLKKLDLDPYCGEYYSPELDTTYRLAVEKGGLVAKHRRRDDLRLSMTTTNSCRGGRATMRFQRNEEGEITGMRVSSGRMWNLKFTKRNAKQSSKSRQLRS